MPGKKTLEKFCEQKPKSAAKTLLNLSVELARLETALHKISEATADTADELRKFAALTIDPASDATEDYTEEFDADRHDVPGWGAPDNYPTEEVAPLD